MSVGSKIAAIIVLLTGPYWVTAQASAQQSTSRGYESEALHREIQQLKAGQREILKRLDALQRIIKEGGGPSRRKPARFTGGEIPVASAATKGSAEAKLVLIEFSDYQCPYCARFAKNVLPQIKKDYVATGKIRYVFRDFPIARIHPAATAAAVAARCAGEQGKYWEMHDRFFAMPKTVKARKWQDHARALALDLVAFDECMADKRHERAVSQSIADGRKVGVTGTPAFFLGTLAADGKTVKATEMIRGAQPYGNFKKIIEQMLAKKKAS